MRIDHGKISHTLYSDVSTQGWNACLKDTTTGSRCSSTEETHQINYLELKAILLGLQSLCKEGTHDYSRVMTDNTTAVAYLPNMGGSHSNPPPPLPRHVMTLPDKYGSGASQETYGFL